MKLGFTVVSAGDGEAALQILENGPEFDVVLLDLTMPRMDGEECLRILSARYPDLKVIISSGFHRQEIAEKIPNIGGVGFIQKPYNLDGLKETLKNRLVS